MLKEAAHLDLVTMKLFVAVVDEGSILRAARRVNIATSAVSKRISEMEAHFGMPLLNRHRRGVEPTSAGNALLPHFRAMLSRLVQIEHEMRDFGAGIRGQLRVSANETATIAYLPDDISAFLAVHPAVQVDFQVDTSLEVVRKVIDFSADIGIFTGSADTGELTVRPYRKDRLVAVVPRQHGLARRHAVAFSDLLEENFIGSEGNGAIEVLLQRAASAAGRRLAMRIRVGSFDAACRLVEKGLGVSVVTEAVARTLSRALDIVSIELDEEWASRELKICVRDIASLPRPAALFLDMLTARTEAA